MPCRGSGKQVAPDARGREGGEVPEGEGRRRGDGPEGGEGVMENAIRLSEKAAESAVTSSGGDRGLEEDGDEKGRAPR
eukprot:2887106-Heterocapsa_arctica.AAC.2